MLQRAQVSAHPAHLLQCRSIAAVDRLRGFVEGEADVNGVNEQPAGGGCSNAEARVSLFGVHLALPWPRARRSVLRACGISWNGKSTRARTSPGRALAASLPGWTHFQTCPCPVDECLLKRTQAVRVVSNSPSPLATQLASDNRHFLQ